MIKKIYKLIFSAEQLNYQRETYSALGFWESYRGWLIIGFVLSWILSIFMFHFDMWSVIFLLPLYGLICWLVYQGRIWTMVLLAALWLIEKINNFQWLILDIYKLIIVILIGIIIWSILLRAIKLELLKAPNQIIKKRQVGKITGTLFILLFGWFVAVGVYYYYPFFSERGDFFVQSDGQKTSIKNDYFGINFTINSQCNLDSDIINHLVSDSYWVGQLKCGQDILNMLVDSYDGVVGADWKPINESNRFFSWDKGKMWNIVIIDDIESRRLLIGGYDYNVTLKEQILSNIRFLK